MVCDVASHGVLRRVTWCVTSRHTVCYVASRGVLRRVTRCVTSRHTVCYVASHGLLRRVPRCVPEGPHCVGRRPGLRTQHFRHKQSVDITADPARISGFVGLASRLTKWERALVRVLRSRRPTGEKWRWISALTSSHSAGVERAPPAVGSRSVRTSGKHQPEERRVAVFSSRWPHALVHKVLVGFSGLNPWSKEDQQ
jgi:hypothetical protein